MKTKKDISIQIIRIFSMLSIIAYHLVTNNTIAQFLTFGVYTFLFMSGYLYSQKIIQNKADWIIKQYKKISIPVFVFLVFILIVHLILEIHFEPKNIFVYIFNLQYFYSGILGATHLWFLSVIMICYILTLEKDMIKRLFNKKIFILLIIGIAICFAYINKTLSNLLFMIITYFFGMQYKDLEKKVNYNFFITLILCVLSIILKIITHHFIDDTPLYNSVIYFIVHLILAYSFFSSIRFICSKINIHSNKFIDYFDEISYFVFITHYSFVVGPVALVGLTNNYLVNVFIILLLSFVTATILKIITENINNLLNKHSKKWKIF